jgi:hypothetical protein
MEYSSMYASEYDLAREVLLIQEVATLTSGIAGASRIIGTLLTAFPIMAWARVFQTRTTIVGIHLAMSREFGATSLLVRLLEPRDGSTVPKSHGAKATQTLRPTIQAQQCPQLRASRQARQNLPLVQPRQHFPPVARLLMQMAHEQMWCVALGPVSPVPGTCLDASNSCATSTSHSNHSITASVPKIGNFSSSMTFEYPKF